MKDHKKRVLFYHVYGHVCYMISWL